MAKRKRLKAIDLFAGAGGLSLGLELAGIDVVGAVEYCPKAVETYKHNFPDHAKTTKCKDITEWSPREMEQLIKDEMELTKANAFTFLVPIFGLSMGVIFYEEKLSLLVLAGAFITISGITYMNLHEIKTKGVKK